MFDFFPSIYTDRWRNWLLVIVGAVSAVLAVVTVVAMLAYTPAAETDSGAPVGQVKTAPAKTDKPGWATFALVFWAIVPPAYFWYEYFVLWKGAKATNAVSAGVTLDDFKHGQEVSRNIWLAFVVLLAALYFK
jgi:hypothetical protein